MCDVGGCFYVATVPFEMETRLLIVLFLFKFCKPKKNMCNSQKAKALTWNWIFGVRLPLYTLKELQCCFFGENVINLQKLRKSSLNLKLLTYFKINLNPEKLNLFIFKKKIYDSPIAVVYNKRKFKLHFNSNIPAWQPWQCLD